MWSVTKIKDTAIRLELNLPRFYICEVLTPFSANTHHVVTCECVHLDVYNLSWWFGEEFEKINAQRSTQQYYWGAEQCKAWPWVTKDLTQGSSQWIFYLREETDIMPTGTRMHT